MRGGALAALLAVVAAPAAAQPPAPEEVIGWAPCAERRLATYEQIADYFRALAAASERVRLVEMGPTAEGRIQIMAILSSEANLARLGRYKEISERLARARNLDDARARELAAEGRAVVWIDFGIHSTERASAQTAPWLAWKVATEESEEMRRIRDRVVFLLVPNLNPDGTTLVAQWYRSQRGTPFEDSSPPVLYQKYAGHDNNRDFFMFNQPESRNTARQLYREWYPQIVYDQHQSAPFPARIFIPPFEDPVNPHIPPLVMRGVNLVGSAMSRRLEREGKSGALSRVQYDTWWNGGMRSAPYYHNMVGILTETGHTSPSGASYDPATFPSRFAGGVSTSEPSAFYPSPFQGGEWSLRDSCEYMLSASMAVLDVAAQRREEWLFDIYRMGSDAIHAGAGETFVIPAAQWDAGAAARLVEALRHGGIEIERATAPFEAGERRFAAGSYLIRGAQAFRAHLLDMLTPQVYPDRRQYPDGPPELPYDITGWTLSLQMGVEVVRLNGTVTAAAEPVEQAVRAPGDVRGSGGWGFVLDPRANASAQLANRLLARGATLWRLAQPFESAGTAWPAGSFVVESGPGVAEQVAAGAAELGVEAVAVAAPPGGERRRLAPRRIGLYRGWGGNEDEGWTRWLLEQHDFAYSSIEDARLRAGALRDDLDVLVLPDASFAEMRDGLAEGTLPAGYTGGMGAEGTLALHEFVRDGGDLVALDSAAELPLTLFGLELRDVTEGVGRDELFVPGTLIALDVDTAHPLAWGMPERVSAFFARSPAFRVGRAATRFERERGLEPPPPAGVSIAARYPERELLRSGWLLGESHIAGRAAVVEARVGEGRVILLGFRVQHRGQPDATFKLLFNALLRAAEDQGSGPSRSAS